MGGTGTNTCGAGRETAKRKKQGVYESNYGKESAWLELFGGNHVTGTGCVVGGRRRAVPKIQPGSKVHHSLRYLSEQVLL